MSDHLNPISRPPMSRGSTISAQSGPSSADETLLGGRTTKTSFFRTWFATSNDLLPSPGSKKQKRGIHWHTPVAMVSFSFLGAATSLAHHLYYRALHGTDVGNSSYQTWVLWIGASLALLTRVSLLVVLTISRTQWVWATLRRKMMTLGGIDALFGVSTNPLYFLSRNMLENAKVATTMAVIMWMLPIPVILTPGTISVITVLEQFTVPCSVRSMVFPFESNATAKRLFDGNPGRNSTVASIGYWTDPERTGDLEPVAVTSSVCNRAFVWAAYTNAIERPHELGLETAPSDTTLASVCGDNCTYTISFLGPALECKELTSWDTKNVQWDSAGAFMAGYSYRTDEPEGQISMVGSRGPRGVQVVICALSIARYTVRNVIRDRRFVEPTIEGFEQTDLPVDTPEYPDTRYLGHQIIGSILSRIMAGSIIPNIPTMSRVTLTTLLDDIAKNESTLGTLIEIKAQKLVVSLLSFDGDGSDINNLLLDVAAVQETTCMTSRARVLYHYTAKILLLVYATSVVVSVLATVAGFVALNHNGVASTSTVSAIIRATRNPTLDEKVAGHNHGGHPMPKELEELKLQFGVLSTGNDSDGGNSNGDHGSSFALGIQGEIAPVGGKRDIYP